MWLWARVEFLASLLWRPWGKWATVAVGVLGAVDLVLGQFMPKHMQEKFPRFFELLPDIDLFAWVSIVLFALLVTVIESAYQRVRVEEQSDVNRRNKDADQLLAFVEEAERLSGELASWDSGDISDPDDLIRNWERRVLEYLKEHDSTLYLRFRTPDNARFKALRAQYRSKLGNGSSLASCRANFDTSIEKLRRIIEDSAIAKSPQIPLPDGFVFIRRAVERLLELRQRQMIGDAMQMSLACDALVAAAREGHACIWGRRKDSMQFAPIESDFWNIGSIDEEDLMADDGSPGKTRQRAYKTGYRTYLDLCIDYGSLDHVWPEQRKKSGSQERNI